MALLLAHALHEEPITSRAWQSWKSCVCVSTQGRELYTCFACVVRVPLFIDLSNEELPAEGKEVSNLIPPDNHKARGHVPAAACCKATEKQRCPRDVSHPAARAIPVRRHLPLRSLGCRASRPLKNGGCRRSAAREHRRLFTRGYGKKPGVASAGPEPSRAAHRQHETGLADERIQ